MSQAQTWLLVARKLSGEASLDELKELERLLLADPELAYKVDLYCRYFEKPAAATRRGAADITGAQQQPMARHLRVRRLLAQRSEQQGGHSQQHAKQRREDHRRKQSINGVSPSSRYR
jgi:hypothetical protein